MCCPARPHPSPPAPLASPLPPSCRKVNNEWSYTVIPPVGLHGVDIVNFTFINIINIINIINKYYYLSPLQAVFTIIQYTWNVSIVHNIAAIVRLQYMVHVTLFTTEKFCSFALVLFEVCSHYPVWLFSMLSRCIVQILSLLDRASSW